MTIGSNANQDHSKAASTMLPGMRTRPITPSKIAQVMFTGDPSELRELRTVVAYPSDLRPDGGMLASLPL